ncbi:ABC transporter substrate-binding protein [Mesorhizobium sp. A623]
MTDIGKFEAGLKEREKTPYLLNRRAFFCSCCAGGVAAAMLGGSTLGVAAQGAVNIKATHGTGLCNLPLFLAHKRQYAAENGVHLEFVSTPTIADITTVFGSGQVDVSGIPYTNALMLYEGGAPIKIVAGLGANGLVIVSQPGLDTPEKMEGKSIGVFQADTQELLAYDWAVKNGLNFADLDVRYFGASPELAQAFIAGQVDAICHSEPYATQAHQGVPGSHILSNGADVYGEHYTDCVLAASDRVIKENRGAIKELVKALFLAQRDSEKDREAAIRDTVGTYFKASYETVFDASVKQPSMVDQRKNSEFITGRSKSMMELGYMKSAVSEEIFDWSILAEVQSENEELYNELALKS